MRGIKPSVESIVRFSWIGAVLAVTSVGCKSSPANNDAALQTKVQGVLAADSAMAGQPIQVAASAGVITLTGSVSNDAQRTLAARDVAEIPGVTKVVDAISLNPTSLPSLDAASPSQAAAPSSPAQKPTTGTGPQPARQAAPIERAYDGPPPPPLAPMRSEPAAVTPPPPPPPSFRTVTLAAGNAIPVRITQTLDSATTQPDTSFSGVVASDIIVNGVVAIPAGATVSGHVDEVKDATHFKGSSSLTVSLTNITRRGEHFAVTTDPYSVQGKGRGSNTAEKTGGGAAVGAILGGIFGGGKGAAIGAAAGAGAGAGSNAITRGQQVQIASESVIRFHLSAPLSIKVRSDGGADRHEDGGLQPRNNQ